MPVFPNSPKAGRTISAGEYAATLRDVVSAPWSIEPAAGRALVQTLVAGAAGPASPLAARKQTTTAANAPRSVAYAGLYGVMFSRPNFLTEIGAATCTIDLTDFVNSAAADPSVEALLLEIDSPGGSVFGTEELARAIAAAAKRKPVVGFVHHMAASAAYYAASQASELLVSPSGMVGSVGVVMQHVDESGYLERLGLKVTTIASSELKQAGVDPGPISDAHRAHLQETVAGYHGQFVRTVARGRKTTPEQVTANYGQGGMVLAKDAVSRGMVDGVATLSEVISKVFHGQKGGPKAAAGRAAPTAASSHPDVAARRARLHAAAEIQQRREKLRAKPDEIQPAAASTSNAHLTHPWHVRKRVAAHEAGHAAAYFLSGCRGVTAHIEPKGNVQGECVPDKPVEGAINRGACLMAGAIAEEMLCDGVPEAGYGATGDDELFAQSLPVGLRGDCRQKARRLIGGAVHAVRSIAATLEANGRISAAEVAAAIAAHPPHSWY
ncbi:MAG: S49 family peptidase [Gemmataceae bacterium]